MESKKHYALGIYCIYILCLLSVYNLSIEVVGVLDRHVSNAVYVTSTMLLMFLTFFILMIRQTGFPLSLFGFTTKNWLRYTLEAIIFSLIFCFFLTLIKWYLINNFSAFKDIPLFKPHGNQIKWEFIAPFLYTLFTPIQVFFTQGAVQSPLLEFLPLNSRSWISVIVSTLVFSAVHVEFNVVFALAVLIPGLCWSTMYLRHRTLISISVSHALIGIWSFAFLDLLQIFKRIDHIVFPNAL